MVSNKHSVILWNIAWIDHNEKECFIVAPFCSGGRGGPFIKAWSSDDGSLIWFDLTMLMELDHVASQIEPQSIKRPLNQERWPTWNWKIIIIMYSLLLLRRVHDGVFKHDQWASLNCDSNKRIARIKVNYGWQTPRLHYDHTHTLTHFTRQLMESSSRCVYVCK